MFHSVNNGRIEDFYKKSGKDHYRRVLSCPQETTYSKSFERPGRDGTLYVIPVGLDEENGRSRDGHGSKTWDEPLVGSRRGLRRVTTPDIVQRSVNDPNDVGPYNTGEGLLLYWGETFLQLEDKTRSENSGTKPRGSEESPEDTHIMSPKRSLCWLSSTHTSLSHFTSSLSFIYRQCSKLSTIIPSVLQDVIR